jgi:hypothetical protein
MRPESPCDAVTAALVAGGTPDATHLAGCAACRARAALVGALAATPATGGGVVAGDGAVVAAAPRGPDAAALRAAARARAARRGAYLAGAALAAAVLLWVRPAALALWAPAPDIDLLAALDDADRAVLSDDPLLGERSLGDPLDDALLDDPTDPFEDALLGEGSL